MNKQQNSTKYLYFLKKANIALMFALLAISKVNNAKATNYFNVGEEGYSYNIFTNQQWELSPYLFFGYSFNWVPYQDDVNGINYKNILHNNHNGIIGGIGVTINKHWSLGVSYSHTSKASNMRGSFAERYPEISSIDSDVNMFNFDVAMRLPFSVYQSKTNFYILGGMNVIYTTLDKNFYSSVSSVPTILATNNNKTAFGANVGLGISYNIIGGFWVRLEGKRLFIITRKTSNIKDSWIFNAVVGVNF